MVGDIKLGLRGKKREINKNKCFVDSLELGRVIDEELRTEGRRQAAG